MHTATFILSLLLFASAMAGAGQRGEFQRRRPEAAEAPPGPPSQQPAAEQKKAPPPEEKTSKTKHSIRIGGQQINYTATAGTMVLKKEDGTATASIFYIAYTKDDAGDPAKRPITFAFNGGPGSSSVWLHLGMLSPKRVLMDPEGNATPPPYKLVDNEYSLLDLSDLVFIDPVSTGYSRAAPGQDARQFHGLTGDLQAVGEFIRLYASRNARWASPKFLAGESYGTTRAAALSGYLQQRLGLYLNGIALISSVLNFETISGGPGNDLPYALFLPSFTATAWYHKKLPPDLQRDQRKTLDEVEKFAAGEYALALMKGDALEPSARAEIARKLARYTGLSQRFVEESNLRVSMQRFAKELLRDEKRTVGRYDSRFKGIDYDAAGDRPDYDPSYAIVQGAFTAALNQYVRADLKFESDLPYEVLTGRVQPWSYAEYQNRYVNVAETLRSAVTQNPNLKVFVACGYYDLATPYFAAEYTFGHMGLDPSLRKNISINFYGAGHMMYIHLPSLEKAKKDLSQFLTAALPK